VLWLSDDQAASAKLQRLGFPYLEKLLDLDALVSETQRVMRQTQSAMAALAASASKMESHMKALASEIAEAHRLFDLVMVRLGYKDR
jgi:hypothetical protein